VSTLYVENSVGRRIVNAFNVFERNHGWRAAFQHDLHPQMQNRQNGDEWWLEDVTNAGYAILTADLSIASTPTEIATVQRVGARLAGFADAQYTAWQMLRALAQHWEDIEQALGGTGPVILRLHASARRPDRIL
jgi:PIN like domain